MPLTPEQIKSYVLKKYENQLHKFPSLIPDDEGAITIPLSLLPQIYNELLGIDKKPEKKAPLLFMKEYMETFNEWYVNQPWNTQKIKPIVNQSASEKNALWGIMRQIQALFADNKPDHPYTAESSQRLFKAILKAAEQHKFLKDKISLHLISKYLNELIKSAMLQVNYYQASSGYNFDHLKKN